ncbi:MAG: DUF4157 domain-containing protein [Proteobacteria bacterium]|nr:DUF4157 domain-containing protein [Pseudomonadota bacterium]
MSERRLSQDQRLQIEVQRHQDGQLPKPAISPGQRTLIMSLPLRRAVTASTRSPLATVAQRKASDSVPVWKEDWTRVVFRPDLYSTPELKPVMQRSTADEAATIQAADAEQETKGPGLVPTTVNGAKLSEHIQSKMEAAFAADFADVQIHEGSQLPAIGTLAYTQGTNVHFAPGQHQPYSRQGQELLGHELTHVVQQRQSRVAATTQVKGVAVNDDSTLEREADDMGAKAACGEAALSSVSTSVHSHASGPGQAFQDPASKPRPPHQADQHVRSCKLEADDFSSNNAVVQSYVRVNGQAVSTPRTRQLAEAKAHNIAPDHAEEIMAVYDGWVTDSPTRRFGSLEEAMRAIWRHIQQ